ncbi:MAG: hypothetical protein FJX67_11625 [Alphaproteobacteria bacterium]|nr:hypothetical protein [Alphaproteobacteria bacterium]
MAKKPRRPAAPPIAANDRLSRILVDLVPREFRGTDRYLDVVNWNIRYFNARDPDRVRQITRVLKEINGDIFVLQEIEDGALEDVVAALIAGGDGLYKAVYGTTGGDQRVAFVYDTEWVKAKQDTAELFADEPAYIAGTRKRVFPRLPLHNQFVGRAKSRAFDFHLIGVHLKSQRAGAAGDDGTVQRQASALRLARWFGEDIEDERDVIVAGDWNAAPDRPEWDPMHALEADGKMRFGSWNAGAEASHFYKSGKGTRLDLVVVSAEAEKSAKDKAARVIR